MNPIRRAIHQLEDWYERQPSATEAIYVVLTIIARTNAYKEIAKALADATMLTTLDDMTADQHREIMIDAALNVNYLTERAPEIAAALYDMLTVAADHDPDAADALALIEDSRATIQEDDPTGSADQDDNGQEDAAQEDDPTGSAPTGSADQDDAAQEGEEIRCPNCHSTNWNCWDERTTDCWDTNDDFAGSRVTGYLHCSDCDHRWTDISVDPAQEDPDCKCDD